LSFFFFLLSPSTDIVPKSKSAPKARPKKEDKVYLEIDARFERPDRGGRGRDRGDRGDRGGDRGDRGRSSRGGRGGPRGGGGGRQNGGSFVNVDDQAAFPSLT
jgi:plasminogen activator inhibitor 1 RNA-binding protein